MPIEGNRCYPRHRAGGLVYERKRDWYVDCQRHRGLERNAKVADCDTVSVASDSRACALELNGIVAYDQWSR